MARNGSGTYTRVNTFTSGNAITAAGHNQNWADLETEMTNSVAADGQTLMTGPLKAANGTAAAPSLAFASDPDSGVYRIGANNVGMAVNGAKVLDVATAGLSITGTLTSSGALTVAADGLTITAGGLTVTAGTVSLPAGSIGTADIADSAVTEDKIADGAVTIAKLATGAAVPTGAIFNFAAETVPSGYLECDGSEISRTTYADLYAVIGIAFGVGNGTTTFNLPDLRGEFVRGFDNGRGVDTSRAFASTQADELKSHTHGVTYASGTRDTGVSLDHNFSAAVSTKTTEATGGAETRPRNIALVFCIKT